MNRFETHCMLILVSADVGSSTWLRLMTISKRQVEIVVLIWEDTARDFLEDLSGHSFSLRA